MAIKSSTPNYKAICKVTKIGHMPRVQSGVSGTTKPTSGQLWPRVK